MSRSSTAATRAAKAAAAGRAPRPPRGYFACSELPLTSLAFLLPLILLYEVGTVMVASDPARNTEQRIIAFNLLQDFFRLFGASGRYLPATAVVLILLCWHVARRDPWNVAPAHVCGMLVESCALALPLVGIGFVATHYLDQYLPLFAWERRTANLLVLSIGAGIYEELVFRLMAFSLLSFLFLDVLGMRRGWAMLLMVWTSAILFSLYHYLGSERFSIQTFAFRTSAGCYFGAVFAFRGLGVTAGSHAAYDVCVVALRSLL